MSGPLRILLLEDNPADADLVMHAVKAHPEPTELEHAERLSQALEWLGERDYAVVVSDLNLPDSQGLDTFLSLHAKRPELPIIVFTTVGDERTAVHALRSGAQDYLVKGALDTRRILASVRFAIERQQLINGVIAGMSRREEVEATLRKCATAHLWEAMFSVLGEGASAVLYRAGHAAGQTTFDFLQATYTPKDDAELVAALTEHFGLIRLFLVQEMKVDRKGKHVEARIRKNFELEVPRRGATGPSCHFLRGLLSGVSARLLGAPDLAGKETACERAGADACTFDIRALYE